MDDRATDQMTAPTAEDTTGGGPGQPPGDRPPLIRRRRGRMVAGVAAGLARHLHVDVTLIRIGFVVLAFTGGAGVLAYVAGWVLLPEEPRDGATVPDGEVDRGLAFWLGIALLGIAAVVLVEHTTPVGRGIGTPLVLIAIGVALWKVSNDRAEGRTTDPSPVAPDRAGAETAPLPAATESPLPPPPPWSPPPARPRPRSPLGRITVAVLLISLGLGTALGQAGVVPWSVDHAAAAALAIVAAGLLVGTWFGRARGLVALGALLVPLVIASNVVDLGAAPFGGGAGERLIRVETAAELEPRYQLGAGFLQLDLSALDLEGDVSTQVSVGAGELEVLLPEGLPVTIAADVQLGEVALPGVRRDGVGLRDELAVGVERGAARLHLDLEAVVGQITVRTVPADTEASR